MWFLPSDRPRTIVFDTNFHTLCTRGTPLRTLEKGLGLVKRRKNADFSTNKSGNRVRQLRSADTRTLVVSRSRSNFGDRTFAAAGPLVWNSLTPNLRLCELSYGQFRRFLKTFFYSDGEATAQCELLLTAPNRNILTYLLTYLKQ